MLNMFEVNIKRHQNDDIDMSLLLTLKVFHTFSRGFIVDFELVNIC